MLARRGRPALESRARTGSAGRANSRSPELSPDDEPGHDRRLTGRPTADGRRLPATGSP